jgi:signal transduction histidine kinase
MEEKRTKQQLEEQKTLLDNILVHSSNGISVARVLRNEDGKVVDVLTILANDAAVRYVGLPRDLYLSKRATEIEPAVIDSPFYQACINTLETGEPFVMQYQMQSTGRWLELSVSKLDYDHLIHIFTDVTPIKEAQLQSEQAAERLRAVFNAAQSGMFIFAPVKDEKGEVVDFRFVLTNPAFAAYVQQTPEVLQGELGSTFFPGYLQNGVFDMYKETYLTGETFRREVHYNVDQHDLYLDLMSTKVQDEVLVTFTDFTHIKKTQLEQEKLVGELRQSNNKLEEFAHAASHDLKEPMRKVKVFSDKLKKNLNDRMSEDERRMFERMQIATERMTLLVDDLLTYSHLSMSAVEMEEVDLNKKLAMVLSDLEVAIEEKNANVIVEPLPVVKGYRRQLQQLFQNLVSNALKYSKAGVSPEIRITASVVSGDQTLLKLPAEKKYHLVEVKDNGIGFDQEYAERIFQMFHRLHGRSEYSGTGIGLAIAKKVVENHRGFIWAEGKPGEGATFRVLLPV